MCKRSIPILLCVFLISCTHKQEHIDKKTERAFYYWKSVFKLTGYEKSQFDSHHITTLYLKFFDIDWNKEMQQPMPVAQVRINDVDFLKKINLVPVIFITNECIGKMDSSQVFTLAKNITDLIGKIATINKLDSINEMQLDCDWTASSKEIYFNILKKIKEFNPGLVISATIRLHQVKFISKSGIPPVDKGLLMCYNMGNLKNPLSENSIIDPAELKKYIGNLNKYPLRLDIAFPLFSWKVLFRKEAYSGLIQNLPDSVFNNSFTEKKSNRFIFLKDTLLSGYSFKKDDVLRCESSDYNAVMAAGKEINKRLLQNNIRLSLFHLDSITLSKYSFDEVEDIYNSIH